MKNKILLIFCLLSSLYSFAQFTTDGYYRIRNLGSQRYIIITDDKGSVNVGATSADLGAVKLYRSFENVVSNPGSVIYVNEVNGLYRFESQGTDTHEIIGYDLKLKKNTDGTYKAYQEQGVRLYLCDARIEDTEEGVLSTRSEPNHYRDWEIIPLDSATTNYFGITPEFSFGNDYYSSFYASFPFSYASNGMAAYYISLIDGNIAVMTEVTNKSVPASMPVIFKTPSTNPKNHKLAIGDKSATAPSNNLLSGVYFHNTSKAHNNLTPYDAETMRVLGITSTGKLGFIKADFENLPANKAYLNVTAETPDELEIMTEEEYENYKTGIECVVEETDKPLDIYTIQGILVAKQVSNVNEFMRKLPRGCYIVSGRKVIIN